MTVGRVACLLAIAISCTVHAQTVKLPIKTPIKGLVSMGAYRFVADGGQPDNTLWPLYRAPKIFGGIVIVATWAELQPSKGNLPEHTSIDRALAAVREYNAELGRIRGQAVNKATGKPFKPREYFNASPDALTAPKVSF